MRRLLFAVITIVALSTLSYAQDKPAGSADKGFESFMKYQCYTCHGTVGQGADRGTGPKLAPNPFPYLAFELQVRQPRQDMPAYRKQFVSDQELADIYAYLLTIKPSPSAKDISLLNFD